MKKITLLCVALMAPVVYAKDMTPAQWDKCSEQAGASVNTMESGQAGLESAIQEKCGARPAEEPSKLTGILGMHPNDVARSKAFKGAFMKATAGKYETVVNNLSVASPVELNNGWMFASGIAQHMGGSEEAMFAINVQSGKLYIALLEEGKRWTYFGFKTPADAPEPIKAWLKR